MDHLGAVAGPVVAFLLLPLVGGSYRAIFWLASIPAAICVLVLVIAVRETLAQGSPARLPLLTGWLWQAFGGPAAFGTGALVAVAAAALLWLLLRDWEMALTSDGGHG